MASVRPATPGEVLLNDFLIPNKITQTKLAEHTGWTLKHINFLCHGKVSITVDSALVLSKVFGTNPSFWLRLQEDVDLWNAKHSKTQLNRMEKIHPIKLINC